MYRKLRRRRESGSAIVEFTLTGIPLLFIWLSTVEMARGMWNYATLQYATKATLAYASMHGATCASPNSCSAKLSDVVTVFENAAVGIPQGDLSLTLTTASGATQTCNPVSTCSTTNASWGSTWPPSASGDNAVGKDIYLRADQTFKSALILFIPGTGTTTFNGVAAGSFDFPGYSHQTILF
jgi:Flp pilus assembly protein TadG